MPIFEYQCDACGLIFEKIVYGRPGDQPLSCPACGSGKIIRKLSTFSVSGGREGAVQAGPSCGRSPFT